jgi:hypothetical protein
MTGSLALFLTVLMLMGFVIALLTLQINIFEKKVMEFVSIVKKRYEMFPRTFSLDDLLAKLDDRNQKAKKK